MAVFRMIGGERELFSVTAVGDGGVRFWFARLHPGKTLCQQRREFAHSTAEIRRDMGGIGEPGNMSLDQPGRIVVPHTENLPVVILRHRVPVSARHHPPAFRFVLFHCLAANVSPCKGHIDVQL